MPGKHCPALAVRLPACPSCLDSRGQPRLPDIGARRPSFEEPRLRGDHLWCGTCLLGAAVWPCFMAGQEQSAALFGGCWVHGLRFCSRVLPGPPAEQLCSLHHSLLHESSQRPSTESCPSLNCASRVLSASPQPATAWPRSHCFPARVSAAQGQGQVPPPCCLPPTGCSGQGCWALPGLSHSSSASVPACALGFPAAH